MCTLSYQMYLLNAKFFLLQQVGLQRGHVGRVLLFVYCVLKYICRSLNYCRPFVCFNKNECALISGIFLHEDLKIYVKIKVIKNNYYNIILLTQSRVIIS